MQRSHAAVCWMKRAGVEFELCAIGVRPGRVYCDRGCKKPLSEEESAQVREQMESEREARLAALTERIRREFHID